MPTFHKFYLLILFVFSNLFYSYVWVDGKEEFKIKKLEYFAVLNDININTTTYPVSIRQLDSPNYSGPVTIGEMIEYKLLVKKNFKKKDNLVKLSSFSDTSPIRNIDDDWISKTSLSAQKSISSNNFSANLNVSIVEDSFDQKKYFFDGSNISVAMGNNALGFGYINRWWGPTHNNNLILSNYSRPSPGVYIKSLESFAFDNFFSFLGNLDYEVFINRLEKDRHIKNPFLIGTRVSINPLKNLQVSFSRTLTIGGEGRRENLTTLYKAFFGAFELADNPGAAGSTSEYDYSNQLAGFDIKYDLLIKDVLASFYVQEIAEDADQSPTSPFSGYIITFGSELKYQANGLLRAFIIEFTRTIADRHNSYIIEGLSKGRNIIYEHGTYKSGYRYRGLPIGAFIDTDSKYSQISYLREIRENHLLKTDFFYAEPNTDANGRNIWGSHGDPFYGIKTKYKLKISNNLSTSFVLTVSDKKLNYLDKSLNKNILGFIAEYNF